MAFIFIVILIIKLLKLAIQLAIQLDLKILKILLVRQLRILILIIGNQLIVEEKTNTSTVLIEFLEL